MERVHFLGWSTSLLFRAPPKVSILVIFARNSVIGYNKWFYSIQSWRQFIYDRRSALNKAGYLYFDENLRFCANR